MACWSVVFFSSKRQYTRRALVTGDQTCSLPISNTLGLVRLAIEHRVPILALCRGFQEVNVALGGSLYQKVHEQSGFNDHRENKDDPLDRQYGRWEERRVG